MSDLALGPHRLGYSDTGGAGQPVVVLHSGGMSSRQWKRLGDHLAPDLRMVAPDFLGYGASSAWPASEPFHIAYDVLAIEALLRHLARPVHLVGHSYGGLIALLAALHHPDRVRSLALFEPVAFGVLYSAGEREAIANLTAADAGAVAEPEAFLRGFVDWWQGAGAWAALPEPTRAAFRAVAHKLAGEVRTLGTDRTPHAAYSAALAACPTLLMTGEQSPLAARRVVDVLGRALPAARVEVIHGAGHMAPLTQHERVNALIAAHVRGAAR